MTCFGNFLRLSALLALATGCTYFELPDKDDWVIGRTMELGNFADIDKNWQVVLHPRGEDHHQFVSKYGYVSIEVKTLPTLGVSASFEGINEAGLTISALAFRTSVYEQPESNKTIIENLNVVPWVLANFQKTADVEAGLGNISVVSGHLPTSVFGLHWAITDADGNSIVVEYVNGQRRVHRNEVHVMTNDPEYGWHVTNLDSYVWLSPNDANDNNKAVSVSTKEFGTVPSALGHGYNLGGLPGDMSPASRFVRMFYLKQYAFHNAPPKTTDDVLGLATGLINNVYLSVGTIARSGHTDAFESTGYAIMKMPKSGKLFVRSQNNMQWRLIDIKALDFTTSASFYVENGFRAGVRDDTGLLTKDSTIPSDVSVTV